MDRSNTTDDHESEHPHQGAIAEGQLGGVGQGTLFFGQPLYPTTAPIFPNLHNLRPSNLTRLINSTPLGTVINVRHLYRHRERAGNQIGNGKRVDLWRYLAWLIQVRHERQCGHTFEQKRRKAKRPMEDAGVISFQDVLGLLEYQNYKCALTGRELNPDTCALDHIIPISRGGKHHLGNAQILHKEVNRAKGILTNDEFIQQCREVVHHIDREKAIHVGLAPRFVPPPPVESREVLWLKPLENLQDDSEAVYMI